MTRSTRNFIWIAGIVTLVLACVLAGCTSPSNTAQSQGTPQVTPVAQVTQSQVTQNSRSDSNSISIENFAFNPASLTVKPGTTVTWTNRDGVAHTIVSDPGSATQFNSGQLAHGAAFTFSFTQAGTYGYSCSIHPSMKGTVVVQP